MAKPFHIVFVSPHSDPEARPGEIDSGGQCVYEFELGRSLSMLPNVEVTILCRQKFGHPEKSFITPHCRVLRIQCGGTDFIPKEKLGPYLDEFARNAASKLPWPPSVVHGHYWDGAKAALLMDKYIEQKSPLVWTPHSVGTIKRRNFIGLRNEMKYNFVSRIAWETFMMVQSDLVIVSTENEKEQIEYDYGVYEKKVVIAAPGAQLNQFRKVSKDQARRALKLPEKACIFMTLGRMDKRKGYNNCIDAFALFKKQRRNDNSYLVIFSGGPKLTEEEKNYKRSLKRLVRSYKLDHRVLFRQTLDRDKVHLAYSASDVYMCLSPYEPFGLTIIESMASGTPVIATSNGGPANIISQRETGYLVNPASSAEISSMMKSLVNSKLATTLGKQAYDHVQKYYDWSVRAKEFYFHYKKLQKKFYRGDRTDFFAHLNQL